MIGLYTQCNGLSKQIGCVHEIHTLLENLGSVTPNKYFVATLSHSRRIIRLWQFPRFLALIFLPGVGLSQLTAACQKDKHLRLPSNREFEGRTLSNQCMS